jgi:hypothetical protein
MEVEFRVKNPFVLGHFQPGIILSYIRVSLNRLNHETIICVFENLGGDICFDIALGDVRGKRPG